MKAACTVLLAMLALASATKPPKCPPDNGEDVTLLPNPDDCHTYYSCNEGTPFLMWCYGNLVFNPELRVCDYPENVEFCGGTHRPSTSPPPSATTPTPAAPSLTTAASTGTPNPTTTPASSTTPRKPEDAEHHGLHCPTGRPSSPTEATSEGPSESSSKRPRPTRPTGASSKRPRPSGPPSKKPHPTRPTRPTEASSERPSASSSKRPRPTRPSRPTEASSWATTPSEPSTGTPSEPSTGRPHHTWPPRPTWPPIPTWPTLPPWRPWPTLPTLPPWIHHRPGSGWTWIHPSRSSEFYGDEDDGEDEELESGSWEEE